jgi:transposase-like protein
MGKERRRYSKEFKAQVAIEALKEQKTLAQLSVEYSIHPNQISLWKNELVGKIPKIFDTGHGKIDPSVVEDIKAPLYEEIGRLKVENDFLKKKSIFAQIRRDLP